MSFLESHDEQEEAISYYDKLVEEFGDYTFPVNEQFGRTLQGEGPYAGRAVQFIRFGGCNLSCSWCTVPGTQILRPDFTWANVEDLEVGDVILGRTDPENGKHGKLVESVVTATTRRNAPLVTVDGTLTCSSDTRVWTSQNRNARSGWREFERSVGLNSTFLAEPVEHDEAAYERGYLAGMADGDGCFWTLNDTRPGRRPYRRFRLALNDQNLLDRYKEFAERAGFELRDGVHKHTGFNGPAEIPCLYLTKDEETLAFEAWLNESQEDDSWAWGYLGGIFDAEGSISNGNIVRISQYRHINPDTYERILFTAGVCNVDVVEEPNSVRLLGRNGRLWKFMVNARPAKTSALKSVLGRSPNNAKPVGSVVDAGEGEVVSLTTSTGNYIAEGWLVHNCDAKFTWDASQYNLRLENPPKTVRQIVEDTLPGTTMIISGGEPLLHQNNPAWEAMLVGFASRGCEVHIETNGTIAPNVHTQMWIAYASVSPKLPHAGKHKRSQSPSVDPKWAEVIEGNGSSIARTSTLKYVVEDIDDIDVAISRAKDLGWPLSRLWVMPEGTSTEELQERWPSIARKAADENINATHRIHVLAFGDTRGT